MAVEDQVNPNTDHATERPGGTSGKVVLKITLGLMLIVPVITVLALKLTQRDPQPLDFALRAQWEVVHVQGTSLERGPVGSARTNQTFFPMPSPISPQQEAAVWQGVQHANLPAQQRQSPEKVEALERIAAGHPDQFYPHYLLWSATGEVEHLARAIALAPRCIVIPVSDQDGRPAIDQLIGDIELIVVKVIDDEVDESLVLRYPAVRTDDLGRANLPVFAGKYRITAVDPSPGVQPTRLIQGYFTFPGLVGRLPAWVVADP